MGLDPTPGWLVDLCGPEDTLAARCRPFKRGVDPLHARPASRTLPSTGDAGSHFRAAPVAERRLLHPALTSCRRSWVSRPACESGMGPWDAATRREGHIVPAGLSDNSTPCEPGATATGATDAVRTDFRPEGSGFTGEECVGLDPGFGRFPIVDDGFAVAGLDRSVALVSLRRNLLGVGRCRHGMCVAGSHGPVTGGRPRR